MKDPSFGGEGYQTTLNEILARDLTVLSGESSLAHSLQIPQSLGGRTNLSDIPTIAGLHGDARRGEAKAAVCYVCHQFGAQGTPFGPNLAGWAAARTTEQILTDLIAPSEHLAHGFDQPARLVSRDGKNIVEGLVSNYSYHSGSLNIKVFGGQTRKILFRQGGIKVEFLKDHSWMPPASEMGLTDQDLRDLAEYLKSI